MILDVTQVKADNLAHSPSFSARYSTGFEVKTFGDYLKIELGPVLLTSEQALDFPSDLWLRMVAEKSRLKPQ